MKWLANSLRLAACTGAGDDDAGALPCTPVTATYRIDHVAVPHTSAEADDGALDLDGDGTRDDETGEVLAAVLVGYADDVELEPIWDARFTGDTVWRIRIDRCDGDAWVSVTDGDGGVAIAAAGDDLGDEVTAEGGSGAAPIGVFADLAGAGVDEWSASTHVAVDLELAPDGMLTGKVGGALGPGYQTQIARAFLPYLQAKLDAGDTSWGAEVDVDHDGTVTVDELLANSTFTGLLDPDIDGDRLSFGFSIHAEELP